jgi:hypothetical protein
VRTSTRPVLGDPRRRRATSASSPSSRSGRTRSRRSSAGPTFWAIEDADELLKAYREWLPSAPRNVTGFFNYHTIPPVAEAFPEELHLRKVCGIVWCIDASDEDAEAAMAPMLSIAEPLLHGVQRMPIAALNGAFDGLYGPGDQWYWRGDFVREIPDEGRSC